MTHFGNCNYKIFHKISLPWCINLHNLFPLNVSRTCKYHGICLWLGYAPGQTLHDFEDVIIFPNQLTLSYQKEIISAEPKLMA